MRIHGTDDLFKETVVNDEAIQRDQGTESEEIQLIDCGEASKTTKGGTWFWAPEGAWPPFNKVAFT